MEFFEIIQGFFGNETFYAFEIFFVVAYGKAFYRTIFIIESVITFISSAKQEIFVFFLA